MHFNIEPVVNFNKMFFCVKNKTFLFDSVVFDTCYDVICTFSSLYGVSAVFNVE